MQKKDDAFSFEIVEHIGTLSKNPTTNWTRELNLVSWSGRKPKLDLRDWDEEHEHMSKGIGLTNQEALKLRAYLDKLDLE